MNSQTTTITIVRLLRVWYEKIYPMTTKFLRTKKTCEIPNLQNEMDGVIAIVFPHHQKVFIDFTDFFLPWNCHIHFFQIRLKVVAKRNFNDWILFRQWRLLLLLLWDHFSNREKILCGYLIVCCGKREKNHHRNFWSCSDFSWNRYSSLWSYVGVNHQFIQMVETRRDFI